MRRERELKAAANRARFAELWTSGTTNIAKLALLLGLSRRNVDRMTVEWKSGKMSEKIAQDLALAAHEAGGAAPAGGASASPAPVQGARDLPEDPGVDLDHMSVARRAVVDSASDLRDRLKAVDLLERRRQYDLDKGIGAGAKNLRLEDWLELTLEDIPQAAWARTFGLLAEKMAHARTPWMSQPETTKAMVEVYHLLGLQVPAEVAVELLVLMAPARAAALARAAELAKLRAGPPPDAEPVDAEEYLTHVPGGETERTALQERVRELTIRKEPGSA